MVFSFSTSDNATIRKTEEMHVCDVELSEVHIHFSSYGSCQTVEQYLILLEVFKGTLYPTKTNLAGQWHSSNNQRTAPLASCGVVDLQVYFPANQYYDGLRLILRFSGATDPLMVKYNESIHFDRAFYAQDILGSIAFARANIKTGILTQDEFEKIENGFRQVLNEWQTNRFEIKPGVDEDIHTANERRLGEIIGTQIAGKLHTYAFYITNCGRHNTKTRSSGRSRNDQVATDLRLWLRDQLREIEQYLVNLLQVVAERAEEDIKFVMPGYTHLQRAQVT